MKGCNACPAYGKCPNYIIYRGSNCKALRSKYGIETDPDMEVTQTHADRIRNMSDEELAESRVGELKGIAPCSLWIAIDAPGEVMLSKEAAIQVELDWLRQPAEE